MSCRAWTGLHHRATEKQWPSVFPVKVMWCWQKPNTNHLNLIGGKHRSSTHYCFFLVTRQSGDQGIKMNPAYLCDDRSTGIYLQLYTCQLHAVHIDARRPIEEGPHDQSLGKRRHHLCCKEREFRWKSLNLSCSHQYGRMCPSLSIFFICIKSAMVRRWSVEADMWSTVSGKVALGDLVWAYFAKNRWQTIRTLVSCLDLQNQKMKNS